MARTQAAITPLVTRCGQALGRLPGGAPVNDDGRSILIEDARAATEDLLEMLLAMAAAVMIGLGSDDKHEAMPGLLKIAAQKDGDDAAARLETLAWKVFTIAQRRRNHLPASAYETIVARAGGEAEWYALRATAELLGGNEDHETASAIRCVAGGVTGIAWSTLYKFDRRTPAGIRRLLTAAGARTADRTSK